MLKRFLFFLILLTSTTLSFAKVQNEQPIFKFESSEHLAIGNQVKLRFMLGEEGNSNIKLKLANGLLLTYGELITLGGDFYGDAEQPIALGKTDAERKQRFTRAYESLATDTHAISEAPQILAVVREEMRQLQESMQQGKEPADIYNRMITDNNIAWNCITGGSCRSDYPDMTDEEFRKIYFLKQGRYLKLADKNFDHFGADAWRSYSIGHQLALEKAIQANQKNDISLLEEAYAINAFSCHYLSDMFSAGHMRTPHLFLYDNVIPSTIGSLLTIYMHNEDGELGLTVFNQRGDTWKAYGDKYYFDDRNQKNREILQEAVQRSADDIFETYLNGKLPSEDTILKLIPDLTTLMYDNYSNSSPLFYWDTQRQTLMRRYQISDPYNYQWTAYWTGWESLLELMNSKGWPLEAQEELKTLSLH